MSDKPSLRQISEQALEEVSELVGCPGEGVTGVRADGDGWVVTIEVLEVGRVPQTTDVLATYDVEMDQGGLVIGYQRVRRYLRASVDG